MPLRLPPGAALIEDALQYPVDLARALRPLLGPHPVPQSDPRTRGLLREIVPVAEPAATGLPPPLAEIFARLARTCAAPHILAINEAPPTCPSTFLMLPHLDRTPAGLPVRTTVCFLDFPGDGDGGELVVFPADRAAECALIRDRAGARHAAARADGALVPPRPGRACRLEGDIPHAVLGYASTAGPWRMVAVLAELCSG